MKKRVLTKLASERKKVVDDGVFSNKDDGGALIVRFQWKVEK